MKNEKIAILLSVILPGLGHLYLRKYFDGLALSGAAILVGIVLYFISTSMNVFEGRALVITLALIFLYAYSIFDVIRLIKKAKI